MIAEEAEYQLPNIETSIQIGMHLKSILAAYISTTPKFKKHILKFTHKNLNEEELTQEFVNLLRRETTDLSFLISNEKKDIYQLTKGKSDFYFYPKEQEATTESFFDVEAKILTDRFPKSREKEYVIGDSKNGGIERYKNEQHGKGLEKCGMIGFIEKENFEYWLKEVNKWIVELTTKNSFWEKSEILKKVQLNNDYSLFVSKTKRKTKSDLKLNHFWIKI